MPLVTIRYQSCDSSIPSHPLGIKPLGNQYLVDGPNARHHIGSFQALPDELLSQLLEFLDQRSLRVLGYTCRFLYAHSVSEELWKALFLESPFGQAHEFAWLGTWRSTLLGLSKDKQIRIECNNVFSDVLHRPFVCSHVPMERFVAHIPRGNQISRMEDMSCDEFATKWSNKPFILTKAVQPWPVCQTWNLDSLLKQYADVEFRAEAVDWTFSTYSQYMFNSHDESPVYLFDKKFAEKMSIQVSEDEGAAYWKPRCFGPDLFELLGPERPAHRWLIIGPERSGSTFHKDPNATSAWNAVIQGAKYWIMFPPSVAVPGVYVSQDNSEVTSPLSIAEWLLEFHEEARQLPACIEGICRAGEILHVPSGWWHLVVNLESGIALTQNFVPEAHLADALAFLKEKPEQVTGFRRDISDPYGLFVERLSEHYPDLLEQALSELKRGRGHKKRLWDLAVGSADEDEQPQKKSAGFSFGFGFGDGDEIEIP
ncbi:Clavaminate synthase-like protein [Thozetella sp. PMI_491]|nr:Clavaminate synthase-like protein [Thozetella sp. PMI_491]